MALRCALHDPCSPNKFYEFAIPSVEGDADKETTVISKKSEGQLTPPDYPDPYDETHKESIYQHYEIETTYSTDRCRVQLPIADSSRKETEPTSVVATLCRPQTVRTIALTASRIGKPPEIPEPVDSYVDGKITGTLLKHWIKPIPRKVTVEGKQSVYEIEAFYQYALSRPPLKTEKINVGITAYLKDEQEDTALIQSDLYNERLKV